MISVDNLAYENIELLDMSVYQCHSI